MNPPLIHPLATEQQRRRHALQDLLSRTHAELVERYDLGRDSWSTVVLGEVHWVTQRELQMARERRHDL